MLGHAGLVVVEPPCAAVLELAGDAGTRAVHNSTRFIMTSSSAETNVLNIASSLGRECLALTKFQRIRRKYSCRA